MGSIETTFYPDYDDDEEEDSGGARAPGITSHYCGASAHAPASDLVYTVRGTPEDGKVLAVKYCNSQNDA